MNHKSNRWVYVLVEVAKREFDSRALIAIELAKKGINVVFGEKDQILWSCCLGLYPPGVIFDKCAQIINKKKWDILKRKGFVFTSLDEEGLVADPDYFLSVRFSKKAADSSAMTFCWGQKQRDMILSKYPNAKLLVVGNPRMSLLHEKYNDWFENERNEIRKKHGEFVLICSSFNPFENAYDQDNIWQKEVDEECRNKMLMLCRKLLHSGVNLVYRPHPSDAPTEFAGIKVDGSFSIAPWLQSCQLLINAKCATSFEAYIARTPCATFPLQNRNYYIRFANAFATKIRDFEEVKRLVELKPLKRPMLDRIAAHNVANLDSPEKPIEIIVERLEGLLFQVSKTFSSIPFYKLYQFRNRLRFFLTNRSYKQITVKYPKYEFALIEKKLKDLNLTVHKFGNVLKISN